jgi:hypothetical protein
MTWATEPGAVTDPTRVKAKLGGRLSAWLRRDFFNSYVCWRAACEEVRLAYERSRTAERSDSGLAFAAFCAALDREEHAARMHAHCARQIRAQLAD